MKPIIFISSYADSSEIYEASRFFDVVSRRASIPFGSLVIPRYSALFYKELEDDVIILGSKLINSYNEHLFVADIKNWYSVLYEFTPKTWFSLDQIPDVGPFVLKGATNSKKSCWETHMYAKTKPDAVKVFGNLSNDGLISQQDIYIRQYVPLNKLTDSISNGPPITEEYRFFILDGEVLCSGFYWSEYIDDVEVEKVNSHKVPEEFLNKVISIISHYIRFFVVDVALTLSGQWIVIELNDAQMSGLSAIPASELYSSLYSKLYEKGDLYVDEQ